MPAYNERAWAIDLVSHINEYCRTRERPIARAGGEQTLAGQGEENSLFPDVLLFGDEQGVRVRQGWELKFPDTQISDSELYANAAKKAERMRVNSFLVWNVDRAILYVRSENAKAFSPIKEWGPIGFRSREEVKD